MVIPTKTMDQFEVLENNDASAYIVGYKTDGSTQVEVRVPFPSVADVADATGRAEAAAEVAVDAVAGVGDGVAAATQSAAAAQRASEVAAFGAISVSDLLSVDVSTRQTADVASVVNGWAATAAGALGGGTFRWDATRARTEHNGGTVISPTVPWNGSASTLSNYLNGVGETSPGSLGCWVRVYSGSVDASFFGARPESTNNEIAINAALKIGDVHLARGTFQVSTPVLPKTQNDLRIHKAATLKAAVGFTGEAVIYVNGDVTTDAQDIDIGGKGTIDCNSIANAAIKVRAGRRIGIASKMIVGCIKYGIHIGDPAATQTSVDVTIHNGVHMVYAPNGANTIDSMAVLFDNVTDSLCLSIEGVGFRTGVQSNSSANTFDQCHVWTTPSYGPMKYCFRTGPNATGVVFLNCYADSPTSQGIGGIGDVYGFYLEGLNPTLLRPKVYLNTDFCYDNEIVGIFSAASGGLFGDCYGAKFFTNNVAKRFKANFSGVYTKNFCIVGTAQTTPAVSPESANYFSGTVRFANINATTSATVAHEDLASNGARLKIGVNPSASAGRAVVQVNQGVTTTNVTSGFEVLQGSGADVVQHGLYGRGGVWLSQQGTAGTMWQSANVLRVGPFFIWPDTAGTWRTKATQPTSDLDGAVVGTQS